MLKAYQRRNIQNFPPEVNPFSCTFAIVTDGCFRGTTECLSSLQQQPAVIGESHTHLSPSVASLFSTTLLPPSTHNAVTPPFAPTPSQESGLGCKRRTTT